MGQEVWTTPFVSLLTNQLLENRVHKTLVERCTDVHKGPRVAGKDCGAWEWALTSLSRKTPYATLAFC